MITFVFATRNRHKTGELTQLLTKHIKSDIKILTLDDINFTDDIEENGSTFEENALIKARAVAGDGYYVIADDSGLEVEALGGKPGILSARYAGDDGTSRQDEENRRKLLRELGDAENRRAKFTAVIACTGPLDRPPLEFTVRGETGGLILHAGQGDGGFGYDSLFYYPPLGKSFAEISQARKNEISHRAKAVKIFAEKFTELTQIV